MYLCLQKFNYIGYKHCVDPAQKITLIIMVSLLYHRYSAEINKLADEHWPKNIVIVTHMFCVTQAIALTGDQVSFTDYCGYVEMSRSSKQKYDWKKVKTFGIEE